jgi:hypothetical protein
VVHDEFVQARGRAPPDAPSLCSAGVQRSALQALPYVGRGAAAVQSVGGLGADRLQSAVPADDQSGAVVQHGNSAEGGCLCTSPRAYGADLIGISSVVTPMPTYAAAGDMPGSTQLERCVRGSNLPQLTYSRARSCSWVTKRFGSATSARTFSRRAAMRGTRTRRRDQARDRRRRRRSAPRGIRPELVDRPCDVHAGGRPAVAC